MGVPDVINACIYVALAVGVGVSIRKVLVDKHVYGVSWYTVAGFLTRSLWNLYFYTYLKQWYSLVGVSFLACAEITYLSLLIYWSNPIRNAFKEAVKAADEKVKEAVEAVKDAITPSE